MDQSNFSNISAKLGGKKYRTATANAIKDTDIMKIKKVHLLAILERYPSLKSLLERIANEKLVYHRVLIKRVIQMY